jgi:hypothetical protein
MKFYRGEFDHENFINSKYYYQIINNKLTAVYCDDRTMFFKNGKDHNSKNAAIHWLDGFKEFCLNDITYGTEDDFTKESWRRFCKLKAFL